VQVKVTQWAMAAGIPPWLQQALRLAFEVWAIVLEALEVCHPALIHWSVLESQIPYKVVNLLFTITFVGGVTF
jgi:hypothetical protein